LSPDIQHLTYLDGGELSIWTRFGQAARPGEPRQAGLARQCHRVGGGPRPSQPLRDGQLHVAPDSQHLMFDSNGRIWIYDLHTATGLEVGFAARLLGRSQVRAQRRVHLLHAQSRPCRVHLREPAHPPSCWRPAHPATLNGEVDWVYEEELENAQQLLLVARLEISGFLQMNETMCRSIPSPTGSPPTTVETQRFPQPGDPNPSVRVGVVPPARQDCLGQAAHRTWPGLHPAFGWVDDKTLWIETLTRDHKHKQFILQPSPMPRAPCPRIRRRFFSRR